MSQPSYEVLIFFGTAPVSANVFLLDDPVKGVLDGATYKLGGDTGTDVNSYAVSYDIERGRPSAVFTNIDAGTMQVEFNNETRRFDPLYAAGPYYGYLLPGIRAKILANSVVLFDGTVDSWNLRYDVSGRSIATMTCEDGLATLARKQFTAWTATAGQTAGTRLGAVLDRAEVGWPGGQRDIGSGIATLQADAVAVGSSVLAYCQLVARSDGPTSFFASRENLLTFRDRRYNVVASAVTFSSAQVPLTAVTSQTGSDNYYTRVAVNRAGGTTQTVTTAAATTAGIRSLTVDSLLLDSDAQSLEMATYYAGVYSSGNPTINTVTTVLDTSLITTANLAALLGLDIGDTVTVNYTPNDVGAAISQTRTVGAIRHRARPAFHEVTVGFTGPSYGAPFILDSATNGILDGTSVLVF